MLKPKYNDYNLNRLLVDGSLYIPLWSDHTLTARLAGGTILGPAAPHFFDFYIGGLIGFKAYPFYSLSGNEMTWLNLTYRFPLWTNIDYKMSFLYFDKSSCPFILIMAMHGQVTSHLSPILKKVPVQRFVCI